MFVTLPPLKSYSKRLTPDQSSSVANKYSDYRQTESQPHWNFAAPPLENGQAVALLPILLNKEHPEQSSVVLQVQNRKVFNHQVPIVELPAGGVDLGDSAKESLHKELKEEMRGYNIMKGVDVEQKLIPLDRAVSNDPNVRVQVGLYAVAVEPDPNAKNKLDERDIHEKEANLRTFEVPLSTFMNAKALDKALIEDEELHAILEDKVSGEMKNPEAFLYSPLVGDARSRLPLKNKPEVDFKALDLIG